MAKRPLWREEFPQLPAGYYWDILGTDTHPMLALHYADPSLDVDTKLLGYFSKQIDRERQIEYWRWALNFRVLHLDTLQELVRIVVAKHRLGAMNNNERDVF